jgi:probable F420-dependent oxidoreductase
VRAGIITFATASSMALPALAVELEERGFDSLWLPEHSHIPVRRETPWPGGPEIPQVYREVFEPLVALAAAASVTSTLRLGTGVVLVVQRDPIQLAKALATLDVLSGGRLEVGVGAGWNLEEMRNHGTDPARRFRLMRERVEAMKAIWTQDEAEYHGELVDFDALHSWPKPVQRPHPRIHVGGAAPSVLKRVVRYGDGWFPLMGRGDTDFPRHVRALREAAAQAGRDPDAIEVSIGYAPPDAATLEDYAQAGITRAVFALPTADRDATLRTLDELQPLVAGLGA